MSCISCLKFLLKVTNYLLLFVGLAAVGFSIYMFKTWHDNGGGFNNIPWFIICCCVVGLVIVVTASVGICGADCAHKSCCLNFYIFLACIILLAQIAVIVAVFVKDVQSYVPEDQSGNLADLEKFVEKNIKVVQYGGIALLVIEVIAVLVACVLSVLDHTPRKNEDDDDLRAPVLTNPYPNYQTGVPVQRTPTDPWSQHISKKYNLDTSKFTYDPERQDKYAPKAEAEAKADQKKGCSIM